MVTVGQLGEDPAFRARLSQHLGQRICLKELSRLPAQARVDLLIAFPGFAPSFGPLPSCRFLLLPEEGAALAGRVQAVAAVSFGLSPRSTLTFSSLGKSSCILALQREIVTLSGVCLERQELPLARPPGLSPLGLLAWAGACLLLDVPPEELADPEKKM